MISNNTVIDSVYTPEELAEKLKLSVATVYKLLSKDEIPYFKIGKSYRIPANAFETYMIREGNLARFLTVSPRVPEAARQFIEQLEAADRALKNQIVAIMLYGSYARGDYNEGSDIDLLVLVRETSAEIEQWIGDLSSDAMGAGEFQEFLSPIRMSQRHWNVLAENNSPLYEQICGEGIVLWPKELKSPKDIVSAPARS